MKKIFILSLLIITAINATAQKKIASKKISKWSYKVGIVSPLPVDIQLQTRIQLRSMMAEAAYKVSPKIDATFHAGYLMFSFRTDAAFSNIVALPGLRYNATQNIYFGATSGAGFFSEALNDCYLLWSPYIGIKSKKISADLRYFNWRNTENTANTVGIVLSYNL